jgi:hypothetical protein
MLNSMLSTPRASRAPSESDTEREDKLDLANAPDAILKTISG